MTHEAGNALVTDYPIRVVGRERAELDSIHGREKVNQSIAVWTGLVKGIDKDKTLLDMVITAGSPSEAWKILLSLVGESREVRGVIFRDRERVHEGLHRKSKGIGDETRTEQCQ